MSTELIEQKTNKLGRKTKYNKTLIKEILEDLAAGLSIRKTLEKPGRPAWSTFRDWLNKYPELANAYAKAKSDGIEFILNDAEKLLNDTIEETKYKKGDLAMTHLVKASVDLAKWKAERLAAQNYGKEKQLNIKNGDNLIQVKWQD